MNSSASATAKGTTSHASSMTINALRVALLVAAGAALLLLFPATTPRSSIAEADVSDLSLAIRSLSSYSHHHRHLISLKRTSFASLSSSQRSLGEKLGWGDKLGMLEGAVRSNVKVLDGMARLGIDELHRRGEKRVARGEKVPGRVTEVMKHLVRDWSDEGRPERDALFPPILNALTTEFAEADAPNRILVPGCGVGRLAYEIGALGFPTDANDYSALMSLGLQLVLNHTTRAHEHSMRPFIHNLSHQRASAQTMRTVTFPDAVPTLGSIDFRAVPGDFLKLTVPDSDRYSSVVTLFFIDTATNLVDYLEQIYRLLEPGGIWVNEGPLLYYGSPAMELPLEDVVQLAELVGFTIESRKTLSNVAYTGDARGMYKFLYDVEFWVARKPLR